MDPRRKSTTTDTPSKRPTRTTAGRWSLLYDQESAGAPSIASSAHELGSTEAHRTHSSRSHRQARRTDAALESAARMLLARYGILFRDLLTRESNAPRWRDLLNILRRLEARGEVRGGRFVSGFGGEQFALPEAVESPPRNPAPATCTHEITVAAADPMNLAGIVLPGDRVAAVPNKTIRYRNGVVLLEEEQSANGLPSQTEPQSIKAAPRKHRFLTPPATLVRPGSPIPAAPTLF